MADDDPQEQSEGQEVGPGLGAVAVRAIPLAFRPVAHEVEIVRTTDGEQGVVLHFQYELGDFFAFYPAHALKEFARLLAETADRATLYVAPPNGHLGLLRPDGSPPGQPDIRRLS